MSDHIVRVGVAVIVRRRDGKILLGKRLGSHGAGTWALPGGHLEFREDPFDCAVREVREETGLEIRNLIYGPYVNNIFDQENKHYITLFVRSIVNGPNDQAKIMEPAKCAEWVWVNANETPGPLFPPLQKFLCNHEL